MAMFGLASTLLYYVNNKIIMFLMKYFPSAERSISIVKTTTLGLNESKSNSNVRFDYTILIENNSVLDEIFFIRSISVLNTSYHF